MKIYLIILSLLILGCTPEKGKLRKSRYNYSVDQLKSDKGEPVKMSENNMNSKYEMYHYEDEVYQVSGSSVIAKFRSPKDHEKNIQYWRHLLSNTYYKIEKDSKGKSSHSSLNILSCKKKGLTIYFSDSGSVLRIGESMGGRGVK